MTSKNQEQVTMRIRIGENELEVTGSSEFVERKITEFIEKSKSFSLLSKEIHHNNAVQSTPKVKTIKTISFAQLLKKLPSKTDVDKVLAAGYYLEKYKKYESFTAAETRELIKGAKTLPPKNANDSINNNIKKGLIMSAGDKDKKISYVLTTDGEQSIENILADG